MSEFQYRAGLNHVGSYQISGIPFVTASLIVPGNASAPLMIVFPSVTQNIIVHNNTTTSDPIRVGFSENGVKGTNYWHLEPMGTNGKDDDKFYMRIKTDRIYLISNTTSAVTPVHVYAELTGIQLSYNLAAAYSGSQGIG